MNEFLLSNAASVCVHRCSLGCHGHFSVLYRANIYYKWLRAQRGAHYGLVEIILTASFLSALSLSLFLFRLSSVATPNIFASGYRQYRYSPVLNSENFNKASLAPLFLLPREIQWIFERVHPDSAAITEQPYMKVPRNFYLSHILEQERGRSTRESAILRRGISFPPLCEKAFSSI